MKIEELENKEFDVIPSLLTVAMQNNALLNAILKVQTSILAEISKKDINELTDKVNAMVDELNKDVLQTLVEVKK